MIIYSCRSFFRKNNHKARIALIHRMRSRCFWILLILLAAVPCKIYASMEDESAIRKTEILCRSEEFNDDLASESDGISDDDMVPNDDLASGEDIASDVETAPVIDTDSWLAAILDELDLDTVDSFASQEVSDRIEFTDLVEKLCSEGLGALNGQEIAEWVFDIFFYELATGKEYFLQMLVFTAIFAILKQFLDTRSHYVSEVTFLMVYAAMMTLLLNSFQLMAEVAQETITQMVSYLSVLVPVYATVILVSGSAATAGVYYEFSFLLMTLLEWLMRVVLVPGIHIFLLLRFLDPLFAERKLTRAAELIESGIRLAMKLGVGAVLGISVIQSLLTPAQDRLTESVVIQSVSSIPGIGSIAGSSGEILLSCGILIKNSVGVAALAVLLAMALTPVMKLFLFTVLYRFLAAILQPVSDPRVVDCVHAVSKGCELYLLLVRDSMLMFFLTVAMVTASSSFVF